MDTSGRHAAFDAASGIVAGVLILTGFALAGQAPAPAEPAAELARHLTESRSRILTGDLLVATGAMFYVWFLAALRTHLRSRQGGEETLSAVVLLAGTAAMTIVVAGVALQSGLVLDESTLEGDAVVRLGFDGYNALITIAGLGFGATAAATAASAARTGALSPALRATGWLTALLQVMTIPGLILTSGFFAPAAPMPIIAFWALSAWSIAVSVFLLRQARGAPA